MDCILTAKASVTLYVFKYMCCLLLTEKNVLPSSICTLIVLSFVDILHQINTNKVYMYTICLLQTTTRSSPFVLKWVFNDK